MKEKDDQKEDKTYKEISIIIPYLLSGNKFTHGIENSYIFQIIFDKNYNWKFISPINI